MKPTRQQQKTTGNQHGAYDYRCYAAGIPSLIVTVRGNSRTDVVPYAAATLGVPATQVEVAARFPTTRRR